MNIKHLFLAAASLGVFAACSDYDPGMSENVVDYTDEELELIQEYTANFVERYGDIDPNHTWGFGELGSEDEALSTRTTIDVNHNEWITFDIDQDTRDVNGYSTAHVNNENIPGFPASDGYYYVSEVEGGQGTTKKGATLDQIYNYIKYSNQNQVHPMGDVTDEEILYVSTWFRTHQNPTRDPFNATSFFVQTISRDYDRVNYQDVTDMANPPAWYETTTYDRLSKLPIKMYLNDVETHYDYNGNYISDDDLAASGSPVTYEMDWLAVKKDASQTKFEHINNFNAGNTPQITYDKTKVTQIDQSNWSAVNYGINGTSYREMQYVYDTGTYDFEVHSSNVDVMNHKWVIKHLTFTGRDGRDYDGWYLAFDIAYENDQETIKTSEGNTIYTGARDEKGERITAEGTWRKSAYRDYDGYYSNYIVKIIPGDGNDYDIETETKQVSRPKTVSARVMCEDLGTTNDFDFNDVVFDVTYTGNGNCTETTVIKKKKGTGEVVSTETTYSDWTVDANGWTGQITLLASGGTLPIYVQNFPNGQQYECHETLLGENASNLKVGEKYNPINVGANVDGIESVTLPSVSGLTSTNPDNINIYVHAPSSEDRAATATQTIVLPSAQGGQYEDVSAAPQKICVPVGTKWMRESQQIEWTHTYFRNWVNKENDEYNFGRSMDWTTQGLVKTNLLY